MYSAGRTIFLNSLKTCAVLVISNTTSDMKINLYVKSPYSTEDDSIVGRVAKGNQANKNLRSIQEYQVSPLTKLHL
jgi:hypothetical protein